LVVVEVLVLVGLDSDARGGCTMPLIGRSAEEMRSAWCRHERGVIDIAMRGVFAGRPLTLAERAAGMARTSSAVPGIACCPEIERRDPNGREIARAIHDASVEVFGAGVVHDAIHSGTVHRSVVLCRWAMHRAMRELAPDMSWPDRAVMVLATVHSTAITSVRRSLERERDNAGHRVSVRMVIEGARGRLCGMVGGVG
jgi:hypothetical protein